MPFLSYISVDSTVSRPSTVSLSHFLSISIVIVVSPEFSSVSVLVVFVIAGVSGVPSPVVSTISSAIAILEKVVIVIPAISKYEIIL